MSDESFLDAQIASDYAKDFIRRFATRMSSEEEYPGSWYDVAGAREADMLGNCVRHLDKTGQIRKHPLHPGTVQLIDKDHAIPTDTCREDSQACFCG